MSELDRLAAVLAGALEKHPGAHKYALEIVLEAMRDPSPEVAATLVPREADPRPALCVWEGMLDALLAETDAIDPGDHCRAPMICTDNHVDDTIDGDGADPHHRSPPLHWPSHQPTQGHQGRLHRQSGLGRLGVDIRGRPADTVGGDRALVRGVHRWHAGGAFRVR